MCTDELWGTLFPNIGGLLRTRLLHAPFADMCDILFVNPMRYSYLVGAADHEWCLTISTAYFGDFVHDKIASVWVRYKTTFSWSHRWS